VVRALAASTQKRLRKRLEDERARLEGLIGEFENERQAARLAETSADHAPDAENTDGGSLAYELELELSAYNNAVELLAKVNHALSRMDRGLYGICEVSGDRIPVARLDALPYATTTVEWAHRV